MGQHNARPKRMRRSNSGSFDHPWAVGADVGTNSGVCLPTAEKILALV
jgi:hypothetical protein